MKSRVFVLLFILSSFSCGLDNSGDEGNEAIISMLPLSEVKAIDNNGRSVDSFKWSNDSLIYECYSRIDEPEGDGNKILYIDFRIIQTNDQNDFFKTLFVNEAERQELIENFQFNGVECFSLDAGTEELQPHIYHFESSHGLSPFVTFLLGFDLSNIKQQNYELNFEHPKFEKGKRINVEL